MVYKRYIKKKVNGKTKIYGPYEYHSVKKNGKVVSEYRGKKSLNEKNKTTGNYLLKLAIFVFCISALFLFFYFGNGFTGMVTLSSENSSLENVSEQNNSVFDGSVIEENKTSQEVLNETINTSENLVENNSLNLTPEISIRLNESLNESVIENETINETEEIVEENLDENVSEVIIMEENDSVVEEINETEIQQVTEEVLNETEDVFNETIEENKSVNVPLKIDTTQYPVVVGMPVKWKKKIISGNETNVSVKLPKDAENIVVYKIEDANEEKIPETINSFSITGMAVSEEFKTNSKIVNFFRKILGAITGRVIGVQETNEEIEVVIEEENATEFEIEYETPAPVAIEQETPKGKVVIISSDYHYENILAYTELSEEVGLNKIKLYYYEESGEKILTNFDAYDSEGNLIVGSTPEEIGFENVSISELVNFSEDVETNTGLVSFITWVVPHLSNQTYEIIIEITKAEHLDSNRNFVEDIYDEVKMQDDIWSSVIDNDEYVRVTFEENLDSENDITVYARGEGKIEVYLEDDDSLIAVIEGISGEGLYKTYLTDLEESNSVFDLKIVSENGLEFDYIVDPDTGPKLPTATGETYNIWNDPNFAFVENESYTYPNDYFDEQDYYNFSLGVPGGATIDGIEINVTLGRLGYGANCGLNISISGDGGTTYVQDKQYVFGWVGFINHSFGNDTDLWGESWSYSNFSNANFRVKFLQDYDSEYYLDVAAIDAVRVIIYYTGGAGDSTPPTFTTIPNNESLFYGNDSLNVTFVGTDETSFSGYFINDTNNFQIGFSSGFLINNTPLAVGSYAVNVSINDSSNNLNWTIFTLEVNQSQSNCQVLFNETSPITFPNTFLVYTDCDSAFTLSRNGTAISNNSEQINGAGAYNFSVQRTDISNYSNTYSDSEFIVNKATLSASLTSSKTFSYEYDNTATIINFSESNSGDSDVNYTIYRNNMTYIPDGEEVNFPVGTYEYIVNSSGGQNYSANAILDLQVLTITSNQEICQVLFNETSPITFPNTFLVWANCSSAFTLYQNDSTISNNSEINSGAGAFNFSFFRTDSTNYSNNYNETEFIVNLGIPAGSLSGTASITYGTAGDVEGTESNIGDGDVSYTLFRNGILVSNPDTSTLAVGFYSYIYNATGGTNYSANASMDTFDLTINQDDSYCGVQFNDTSPLEYPGTFLVWSNCSSANYLMRNGTIISNNSEQSLSVGAYNFSTNRTDTINYSSIYSEREFRIVDTTIPSVVINSPTNTTYTTAIIIFNVTATNAVAIDTCLYSLDGGTTNYSLGNFVSDYWNATNSSMTQGLHTVNFYCNDTSNNWNSSESISFTIDSVAPSVVVNSPANNSYASSNVKFDVDISDSFSANTYAFINDSDFVGYWTFDTTNSTGVFDTSGNDNFGTFNGDAFGASNISDGMFGDALEFDGVNDYVDLGSAFSFATTDSFSVSAWIKPNDISGLEFFIDRTSNTNQIIAFYKSGDDVVFRIRGNNGVGISDVTYANVLTAGNWYHVVGVRDVSTDTINIYVNGLNVTPVTDATTSTINPTIRIGADSGMTTPFNGSIDEVMVFNRSLSSDEISALYNSSAQKFNVLYNLLNSGQNIFDLIAVDESSNINLTKLFITNDVVKPTITFQSPTPDNNSITNGEVTIKANVTDNYDINTSTWIDFDNSLVGYWMMGDSYNSTGVFDNSSYDNFGIFNGDAFGISNISDGMFGDALEFDGVDDDIQITNDASFQITGNLSLSAWFKTSSSDSMTILARDDLTNRNYGLYTAQNGKVYFYIFKSNVLTQVISPLSTYDDGNWHHVVGINNGTDLILYIDGNYINKNSGGGGTIDNDPADLYIGSFSSTFYWNGSIDEVLIFNRSLSEDEISALYDSKSNLFQANFSSLSEGEHNYTMYAIDEAGNLNNSIYRNLSVDSTKPLVDFVNPTDEDNANLSRNYSYVNVSSSDSNEGSVFLDWDSSLIGYWMMGDSYNSTGVFDNSSYDNFGSFQGGLGTNNLTGGARGYGLEFDGTDDYVYVSPSASFDSLDNISVSAWIKTYDNTQSDQMIVSIFKDSGDKAHFWFDDSSNGIRAYNDIANANQYCATTSFQPTNNTWYHVVWTIDGTYWKIYINGIEEGSTETSSTIADMADGFSVGIGRIALLNERLWNGMLDEVMLFNRSLSLQEIQSIYNATAYEHNFTNLAEGSYTAKAYAVDLAGNLNETELRTFNFDYTNPATTILYPANITYNVNVSELNYSVSESSGYCWYSINQGLVNSTAVSAGTNFTNVFSEEGTNNWTVYCNDSANNLNSSIVYFYKDTVSPTITWVVPASDNSSEFNSAFNLNITFADSNLFRTLINITNSSGNSVYSNQTDDENVTSHTYTDLIDLSQEGNFTIEASATDDHTKTETDLKKSKKGDTILVFNSTSSSLEMEISFIKKNGQPQSLPGDFASSISDLTADGYYKFGFNFTVVSKGDKMVLNITSSEDLSYRTPNSGYKGHFVWDKYYFDFEDLPAGMNLSVTKLNDSNYLLIIEGETEWENTEFVEIDPVAGGLNTITEYKTFFFGTIPEVTIVSPTSGQTFTSASVSFETRINENSTCNYSLNAGVTNYSMTANSTGTGHTATRTLSNANYIVNYYCADIYGNVNNTENVSFSVAVSAAEEETPSGSQGGGGGGRVYRPKVSFELDKESYEITIPLNRVEFDRIEIENTGELKEDYEIIVGDSIKDLIIFDKSKFSLEVNASTYLEFRITSPEEAGIYPGIVTIKVGSLTKEINVVVNTKTEKSLFDIVLSIPKSMKTLKVGKDLNVQIDLLQMGIKEKMDVTLNYVIKDFSGKVYLIESETIAVYDQKTHYKEFMTNELEAGDYVLGVELIYPDDVAVASSQFKVRDDFKSFGTQEIILLIVLGAIIFVALVMFFIIKRYKKLIRH